MTGALRGPGLNEPFTIREVSTDEIPRWYHVYSTQHYPTTPYTFAKGWGNTRFAPIAQHSGQPVHTYYVASDPTATYMESILHDVVLAPPGLFEVASLAHYHIATLELSSPIRYASFHTLDLPKLGITRTDLIDSPPTAYERTRKWSQAAYLQQPTAQAVGYSSKRNDAGRCLMLFEQRLPSPPFTVLDNEKLSMGARRGEVLALVRSLGLREV